MKSWFPSAAVMAATLGLVGAVSAPAHAVIGGQPVLDGVPLYEVSLQQRVANGGSAHHCGGVLLDANTVITTEHCVVGRSASSLQIRYGSLRHASGGATVYVKAIHHHPGYNPNGHDNDIALLKLASDTDPARFPITTVRLPSQGDDFQAGDATASGWGSTQSRGPISDVLRQVTVPVISRAKCQAQYRKSDITDSMVCAGPDQGGKGTCDGDSGGALVTGRDETVLQGLTSWGRECGRANSADVYTRVGNYVDWIQANRA